LGCCDQQVAGSNPGRRAIEFVKPRASCLYTCAPSPSSIIGNRHGLPAGIRPPKLWLRTGHASQTSVVLQLKAQDLEEDEHPPMLSNEVR